MRQVFVYPLEAAGGNGHAPRAHELKHTVQVLQVLEQGRYLAAHPHLLHDGERGVHLHDVRAEPAYHLRGLGIGLKLGHRNLIHGHFALEYFRVGEIMRLDHVNLLLDLPHHLLHDVFGCPAGYRVLVHSLDGRRRHVQALDIDLAAGEHGRYLVQRSREVLRMNDYRIQCLIFHILSESTFH